MSSLLRSNLTVAAGTAASRVTGLIRVSVLGAVLGQTFLTDAYNQANSTPNIVYELLLGGIFSATLVPLFTRLHEAGDVEGTRVVASIATLALAVLTVAAVLAAPLIFGAYSVGAHGLPADYQQVGTALSRLFLLQILFYGLTAIGSALLNARRRYVAAAWSPVLSNLVIIGSLWFVPRLVDGAQPLLTDVLTNGGLRYTLGLGATAGIAVMALALVPALASAGVPMSFRFDWKHPVVAQLRRLSGFALGYVAANQLAIVVVQNLLVGVGEGTQDAYTKAFTWFVLPHGLLAVTLATTFAPEMTRAVQRRERQSLIDQASLGIRITALFTVPAGFGLFTLRRPIVGSAFQYGQFTADDGVLTSRALAGFALGLGAFSVYLFVLRVFYAHQDSRTPFVINVVENAVNIVLALVLVDRFGVLGLGAAFALAYTFAAGWSLQVLSYKVRGFSLRPIAASLWRIVLASVVMSEVVWLATKGVGANAGRGAVMRVFIGTAVGGTVYVAVLWLLGSDDVREVARRIRRRPASAGNGAG